MGLGDNNRFALVTNHRNLRLTKPDNARSRGNLVTDFIHSPLDARHFCAALKADTYAGFNLLLRDHTGWYHYSNITRYCRRLEQGLYGLSNALLDTPWHKTLHARASLQQQLAQGLPQPEQLLRLLHDRSRPEDYRLPDTGLPLERERLLSSCFIVSDDYGTRASSLLLQHRSGHLLLLEESYRPDASISDQRRYHLNRPLLVQA